MTNEFTEEDYVSIRAQIKVKLAIFQQEIQAIPKINLYQKFINHSVRVEVATAHNLNLVDILETYNFDIEQAPIDKKFYPIIKYRLTQKLYDPYIVLSLAQRDKIYQSIEFIDRITNPDNIFNIHDSLDNLLEKPEKIEKSEKSEKNYIKINENILYQNSHC